MDLYCPSETVGGGRRFSAFCAAGKGVKIFHILPFEYLIMAYGYDMIVAMCSDKFRQDSGLPKRKERPASPWGTVERGI